MSEAMVNRDLLPPKFPTNLHPPEFWEALGRAVATFGFLEEILGKAIFAFTAMQPISAGEVDEKLRQWQATLEQALYDPLGKLISRYGEAVRSTSGATIENLDELLAELRKANTYRNVLCHGSWQGPDKSGRSLPLFVTPKLDVFDTQIDEAFLDQVQRHTAELACEVVDTVTQRGWQFPGSSGPGKVIG